MGGPAEDVGFPFATGLQDIVFNFLTRVISSEFAAEDRIAKAGLVADAGCEGDLVG